MMDERLIPFARARSIYDIPVSFYKENGITVVLSDLDNTLDPAKTRLPRQEAFLLKGMLEKEGITFAIVSNNTGKRVRDYADALGAKAYYGLRKPFSRKLRKLLESEGYKRSETVLVGDQLMTDAKAASGAGIRFIYTERLVKEEPLWTKFNRLFEKKPRKRLESAPYIGRWRKIP